MCASALTKESEGKFLLHDKVDYLPNIPVGTIIRLSPGRLLAMGFPGPHEYCDSSGGEFALYASENDGAGWEKLPFDGGDLALRPAPTGVLIKSSAGTIICAFPNTGERHWTWDDTLKDAPGAVLPTYVMRSRDDGRTWTDVQKLHWEWTGATRDVIETRDGRIVFTSMKMLFHPGRHGVMSYSSRDDGLSWQASNLIDLGGNGHHGGVTESTIVELADGSILKYLRTNWGCFWRAESHDGGRSWHPYGPTTVEASSAPGILRRLASGRVVLLWNRTRPEACDEQVDLRGGDGVWSATPVSNYRRELSIAFSEDDCATWSRPIVIARGEKEISYPQVFEYKPGELWVTAHRWNFRVRLAEADFLA